LIGQRIARASVALLLLTQLIASLVLTVQHGWWGLAGSLLAAPIFLLICLGWAIPPAIALTALGFLAYSLYKLVHWIVRGPAFSNADTRRFIR
jgi:hypothetical protein